MAVVQNSVCPGVVRAESLRHSLRQACASLRPASVSCEHFLNPLKAASATQALPD